MKKAQQNTQSYTNKTCTHHHNFLVVPFKKATYSNKQQMGSKSLNVNLLKDNIVKKQQHTNTKPVGIIIFRVRLLKRQHIP